MEVESTPGIGHNKPSLEDRIFSYDDATPEDVLKAVATRIAKTNEAEIASLATSAKALVANIDRMPEVLDDASVQSAYSLLAAVAVHEDRVEEMRAAVIESAKATLAALTALCKPIDANLAKVDKQIRPMLIDRLVTKIDAHNDKLGAGEKRMTTLTEHGASGSKATLVDGWSNVVVDSGKLPTGCTTVVPDQKAIDAAMEKEGAVPGVERKRDPSLRISK